MSNTKKTIAGSVAALAAAGGVALLTMQGPTDSDPDAVVDDIAAVSVTVPTVSLPTVGAATVSVPAVESYRDVTSQEIAALGLPEVSTQPVTVPEVEDPTTRMPALIERQKLLRKLFRDSRSALHDPGLSIDSPFFAKWIAIYQDETLQRYRPEYKPLEPGLRIINEVKCPKNAAEFATMQERLDYYVGRGYNAVLVTFDTGEDLARLVATVDYIKSSGLRLVIAYAGKETLKEPVFRDPALLQKFLATLGGKADALLLGWRRTSLHQFLPDRQWTNFLIKAARSGNPELPFIGMAYFGETAETDRGVTYDVPENSSAVLVVGIGYPSSASRAALEQLFPEIAHHKHKIGLALGETPYFDSLHDTGRTKASNDGIKRRIELQLLAAGFESTMTCSGDGSDGQYGRADRTENLCLKYGAE